MLVKEMHQAIKDLLRSAECAAFLKDTHVPRHETGDRGDTLIRKIIEAVSPIIIPINIRNRSLGVDI